MNTKRTHINAIAIFTLFMKLDGLKMTTNTFNMLSYFVYGAAAQRGLWPPHSRGFLITYNDVLQSVGLLWTSDSLSQRPLLDNT
jgi:hypothetical protein